MGSCVCQDPSIVLEAPIGQLAGVAHYPADKLQIHTVEIESSLFSALRDSLDYLPQLCLHLTFARYTLLTVLDPSFLMTNHAQLRVINSPHCSVFFFFSISPFRFFSFFFCCSWFGMFLLRTPFFGHLAYIPPTHIGSFSFQITSLCHVIHKISLLSSSFVLSSYTYS